jgi:hypothetical protein
MILVSPRLLRLLLLNDPAQACHLPAQPRCFYELTNRVASIANPRDKNIIATGAAIE